MTTRTPRRGSRTTHAVDGGCLRQLDLPVHPGHLTGVRVVEANVPRLTGPDWLFIHGPVTFVLALPDGLAPGAVVEWEDGPCSGPENWAYTVVTAISGTSVTFAHCGRGPDGALAAAVAGNAIRNPPPPGPEPFPAWTHLARVTPRLELGLDASTCVVLRDAEAGRDHTLGNIAALKLALDSAQVLAAARNERVPHHPLCQCAGPQGGCLRPGPEGDPS